MSKVTRRQFIKTASATAAATALARPAQAASNKPPNIVIIMADDMGYSDIGCYGGEIDTPNLNRMAEGGLRFTQFYNNAKCAPTRASLLTGLYSQQCGVHDRPVVMENCVTIAEVLRGAGYRTLMTGKWHAEQLPTDRGFDRYYGLADGCCNFWNPGEQREGEPKPAEKNYPRRWSEDGEVSQPYTPEDRDWFSTDAFTDHAIEYLDEYADEDKPFFLYLPYTAPHYPLHAHPEDIAKYRGKYMTGWDVLRERRRARMIEMGLIKESWGLAPRDERVAAWDDVENKDAWDMDAFYKKNGEGISWEDARDREMWDLKMAVYAAMVDRMDQNIGRLMAKIRELGEESNTLVLFLADNGGCAETRHVTPDIPPGPVESYRTCDPPWAMVQNTPFRKYKRWDHEGGISTPLVAYWPGVIEPGTMTGEVGHIIDLMPTCLDLAGAAYPESFAGDAIPPCEGKTLRPVLEGGTREGHEALYFQFLDCRAVRSGDWKAVWAGDGPWELYNIPEDRCELNDRVKEEPDRVNKLAAMWDAWAERCGANV
jgi:arylsulfatase A-like enzyme